MRVVSAWVMLFLVGCNASPGGGSGDSPDLAPPSLGQNEVPSLGAPDGPTQGAMSSSTGVELQPNVYVLSAAQMSAVTVFPDRIVVTGNSPLTALKVGDVISSAVDQGFLRKITSITIDPQNKRRGPRGLGDSIYTFFTAAATLRDAIRNASFELSYTPDSELLEIEDLLDGTTDIGLWIGGEAEVTPTINLKGALVDGDVQSLELEMPMEIMLHSSLSIRLDGGQSWGQKFELAQKEFRTVHFIGVVPVVEIITFTLSVGVEGELVAKAKLEVNTDCTVTLKPKLTFDGMKWSGSFEKSGDCTGTAPTESFETSFEGKVFLEPRVDVKFYGIAGPFLQGEGGMKVSLAVCPDPGLVGLYGYHKVSVGAQLNALGIEESYEADVIDVEVPITEKGLDLCHYPPPFGADPGRICNGDACSECGLADQQCCKEESFMGIGLDPCIKVHRCVDNLCKHAGELGEPCIRTWLSGGWNYNCKPLYVHCRADTCISCGGLGQECCDENQASTTGNCTPGLRCNNITGICETPPPE